LSSNWAVLLDQRIAAMVQLCQALGSCIGCGCLSLDNCALYNAGDRARALGHGPRFLMGNTPGQAAALEAAQPAKSM
jgi:MerR family redox-sensitive transcriptional activator SoxR